MISRINIEKSNKMPAVITDQFRILNASNFVDTVTGVGGARSNKFILCYIRVAKCNCGGFW